MGFASISLHFTGKLYSLVTVFMNQEFPNVSDRSFATARFWFPKRCHFWSTCTLNKMKWFMKLSGLTLIIFSWVLGLLGMSPEDHKTGQRETGETEVEKNTINCLFFYALCMDIVSIAVACIWPPMWEKPVSPRLPAQNFITSINLHSLLPLYLLPTLPASPAEVWVDHFFTSSFT